MNSPQWLDRLNCPQQQAVAHHTGPLLVLAGAGSGKTRVLTHRVAHLIEAYDVRPDSIVAVTFTNRAADEMRRRVDALVDDDRAASKVIISTFHSLGARLLRQNAPRAGLDWNFSIYDATDQRRLVAELLDRRGEDRSRASVRRRRNYIDNCKNQGITADQAIEQAYDSDAEDNAEFYQSYQEALRTAGAVDFGDLILLPLVLFRSDRRFAEKLSHLWRFVMVDEFQDTNPAQYELLDHLTTSHDNLAVVGDDDQAIYRWRGADLGHILGFEDAYDSTHIVKLEQNYRSTSLILDAANDVIAENDHRHPKELWTDRPQGEPIVVFTGSDDREEASYVAETIFDQIRKGADAEDFAIFYRTNAQGRLFEEQLRQWGLDYRIIGGLSFYDREEIKDILAYLRAALNPYDDIATERIINTPRRGVGKKTVEKLKAALGVDGIENLQDATAVADDALPTDDLFSPRGDNPAQSEALDDLRSLRGVSRGGITTFRQLLEQTRDDLLHFESLTPIVERLVERIAYDEYVEHSDPDRAEDRLRNLGELLSALEEFERAESTPAILDAVRQAIPEEADDPLTTSEASIRLRAFLDRSALVNPASGDGEAGQSVTLMTIHGAKGLEFDTVFVVGMEEDIFPNLREHDDPEELAEERRLAYVAITRAENRLYLTNARRRRVYGKFKNQSPSRFLLEIDPDRLHVDARSTCDSVDYGTRRRARSGGRSGGDSSYSNESQQSSWSFDQSPADNDDDFNQSLPDWSPDSPSNSDAQPSPSRADVDTLVGATVSHTRFGVGEVLNVSGSGDEARLKIDFPAVGEKTVYRKFLKILG